MKRLVWTGVCQGEIQEAPIPAPGPGQAVIRIKYAGICGSDLHVFAGLHPSAKPPLVMGHEACGTLYAINADRTDLKAGDMVCCHTVKPCGACEGCTAGKENLCTSLKIMGTNFDGVFSQYVLVDASRVIKFRDGVDEKLAALTEPLTVAVHDVRRAGLRPGENVFICGAGPIGLIIGIMCRFSGAARVVLSEIDDTRIRLAREMGFTVVDPREKTFDADLLSASAGERFDKAFEITSVQSGFDACVHQLKRGGVMVQVGMPPRDSRFALDIDKLIYSECSLLGVRHHTMNDMIAAARLIDSGVLDEQLRPLVSVIYPLEEYMTAFSRAKNDKSVLRVLLDLA